MPRFIVKAAARTAIRVPNVQRFAWQAAEVDVTNWQSGDTAGPFHRGLFFDVRLLADDAKAAVALSRPLLEQLESTFAFVTAAGISHAQPVIALSEAEAGVSALQYHELPVVVASRRHLDRERFRVFWEALNACGPDSRQRIDRAIAWHRKGAFEELVLDRFQSWWNALESLNPLIQAKYGLSATGPSRSCPHCAGETPGGPVSSGARRAVESVGGAELWRIVSDARNDIVHARRSIGEVAAAVDPVLSQVSRAVREAILDLVEVPLELRAGFVATPMTIPREYRGRLEYQLPEVGFDAIPIGQSFPQLELVGLDADRKEVEGRIHERVSPTYGSRSMRVEFLSNEIEVVVDPDDATATLRQEEPTIASAPPSEPPNGRVE